MVEYIKMNMEKIKDKTKQLLKDENNSIERRLTTDDKTEIRYVESTVYIIEASICR